MGEVSLCLAGNCISVVGQDSYFKRGGDRNWELPDAIDHTWVLRTLRDERRDNISDLIIFEGFKAYWDEEVVRELDLILWIRVKEETSRMRRMRNKSVTHEVWAEMWQHHSEYEKHWVETLKRHVVGEYDAGCAAPVEEEKCVALDGEQPAAAVLDQAIEVLFKRGWLKKATDSEASTSRSRSRSRGRSDKLKQVLYVTVPTKPSPNSANLPEFQPSETGLRFKTLKTASNSSLDIGGSPGNHGFRNSAGL